MINSRYTKYCSLCLTLGSAILMAACGGGSSGDPTFGPSVPAAPLSVKVVAGDSFSTDPQNTISWAHDAGASEYRVYWATAPGVSTASGVLTPSQQPARSVTHRGVDVVAGTTYYYRVEAVVAGRASPLSAEVAGTPQASITASSLADVAWNGVDTVIAVGAGGTIIRSANAMADGWTDVSSATARESLAAVDWDDVNNQFIIVGAGSTVLTGDGSSWLREDLSTFVGALDLNDVKWLGGRYIAVGNNGVILLSNSDGSSWTAQNPGQDAATQSFNAVASNGLDVVLVVGTNGSILASDTGADWNIVPSLTNNDLNDVTWDGSRFVVAGSNDTILTSPDGIEWTTHTPGTVGINFDAVSYRDAGDSPDDALIAAVGSAGTFVIGADADPGAIVSTGANGQLRGMTWLYNDPLPAYSVIVGDDGTVLTTRVD